MILPSLGTLLSTMGALLLASIIFILYFILTVAALRRLRLAAMSETTKFLWAALIVLVPLLGAVAALIVLAPEMPGQIAR